MIGPSLERQRKSTLTGYAVGKVMRRKVVRLLPETPVETALRHMIKFRVGGLLIEYAAGGKPAGVLSKTDILGAYYAELPLGIAAGDIMSRPVQCCRPDNSLEEAMTRMKSSRVSRLFVNRSDGEPVEGVLAYPEVVGMMYRHCHYCPKSLFRGRYISEGRGKGILRLSVAEIMSQEVPKLPEDATISQVVEELSGSVGMAVLLVDTQGLEVGVVTASDVVMAYRRRLRLDEAARGIMTSPVRSCPLESLLEEAIATMILADVGRIFVRGRDGDGIVGILNLADAAMARSGSCQACIVGRITISG